ncbi:hypothetical protein EDB84DRAFT_1491168 [Lactarius hengduanensis]|nr:hypothetical protein EDB84DRAFT_1491168 [Lactarius hengduanensis]
MLRCSPGVAALAQTLPFLLLWHCTGCTGLHRAVTLVPVTGNVVTHRTWARNIFVVMPPLGGVHRVRCVAILGPWPSIRLAAPTESVNQLGRVKTSIN